MTHTEFSPYHNRYIKFKLSSGEEKEGVVFDIIQYDKKKTPTEYVFIPTIHIKNWEDAERKGNKTLMNELEEKVDIADIVSAEVVH